MEAPLVSVICTCFNHAAHIEEALQSVAEQGYDPLELIIIDNGSRDDSVKKIQNWVLGNQQRISLKTLFHPQPLNYCQSFNLGLAMIRGKFLIDLSGDDVLLPGHVDMAVKILEDHPFCIYFSNALLIKEGGVSEAFYPVDLEGEPLIAVESGDIYQQVIHRTVVCAPTLVFPTQLLVDEGGYDESLAYEDFDIIVRLARKYNFIFSPYMGVKKRVLRSSFSAQQYRVRDSVMLPSTLKVCYKIRKMNRSAGENAALVRRLLFEAKHALASANFEVATGFLDLAAQMGESGPRYCLWRIWAETKLDLSFFYKYYVGLK